MIDTTLLAPQPALEKITVFAQVVKQARYICPLLFAELGREFTRECRNPTQVLAESFPLPGSAATVGVECNASILQQQSLPSPSFFLLPFQPLPQIPASFRHSALLPWG